MNTIENIKKIALIFFIVLGTGHITGNLMVMNGYFLPFTLIISRVLDIPFAMISVIYGLVSIRANMEEKNHTTANILIIAACAIIFAGLVYISLFIPDRVNAPPPL